MRKTTNDLEILLCPNCSFPNKPKDTYCKYCETPLVDNNPSIIKRIKEVWEKRYEINLNNFLFSQFFYLLVGIFLIGFAVYLLISPPNNTLPGLP